MKKREFLNQIKNDFEKAKSDETLNQGQKNSKYASMMTSMEQRFKIPYQQKKKTEREYYINYLS